jgi:hypothetical protein
MNFCPTPGAKSIFKSARARRNDQPNNASKQIKAQQLCDLILDAARDLIK